MPVTTALNRPHDRVNPNPKCAITRACYHNPEVQRAYAECAEGYGFKIEPCPPRDPKKKGRVESAVKYLKRSFVPLREFRDLADANAQLRAWLLGPAGNRIHGTTHEKPLTRFVATEREFLRPLPSRPPELAVWARVKLHPDCHVQFEKTYYSAPFRMVRQHLWLRATETTVQLFRDHELVAAHPRRFRPGSRATINEHLPPEAIAYKLRDPQWCLRQSEDIGVACHTLITDLATCRFVAEKVAVLIAGPCGTGKSHIAQALGHAAVRADHDVLFTTQSQLLASLNAARAINAYERRFQTFARVPLLVIDDFGLKPLRAPQDEDFHDLVAERYEQGATIVTSNLDFSEWGDAFPNRLLGAATLDRLRHGAYRLTLEGESYRSPRPMPEPRNPTVATGAKTTK